MYDQETRNTSTRHKREVDVVCHAHGQHNPVHLRFGYGGRLSFRPVGKTSGQSRNLQDAQSSVFHSDRGDDRLPKWYQVNG